MGLKWHHKYWRPITGITEDDGNPATERDPSFYPLGAPATNARGPNFTPPFPAYPSGHAAFGGALFEVIRAYFGEYASFEMISDEFNGMNRGMGGDPVRPLYKATFVKLGDAEWKTPAAVFGSVSIGKLMQMLASSKAMPLQST